MVFSLAVTWADVGVWLLTLAGMAAIAVFAWKLLQRQEDRDPAFLRKLDDDDARARGE